GIYFFKPDHGAYGWAGADYGVFGRSGVRALHYKTGGGGWHHHLREGAAGAGGLATAYGETLTGPPAGKRGAPPAAQRASVGGSAIGRVGTSPITYELDGRQYVLVGGGASLYAWTLPEAPSVR